MAFTVRFYSFSKRTNSTKTVTGTSEDYSCVLKENTDIINPTIIINGGANFNPKFLNYCWISQFNRYYFINTWRYVIGSWECDCEVDVLATFKTVLGTKEKYVLRSAYKYNRNIVDTLYPSLAWQANYYTDTANFQFIRETDFGCFVLGIANRDSAGFGAISYYRLDIAQIRDLVNYMLQPAQESWTQGFNALTDALYRSIYGAFDYIKSCKWFPMYIVPSGDAVRLDFGNYSSNVFGYRIPNEFSNWYSNYRSVYLPESWLSLDAKYRTAPFAHLYLVFNPFGVIELNPLDFTDTRQIKLYIYSDYISGNGILKIYKVVGTTEYFITQKTAKMSVDVNLTQQSFNVGGIVSGVAGTAAALVTNTTAEGLAVKAASAIAGAGSFTSAIMSGVPSISGSVGQTFDDVISMDGIATLIYQNCYFAEEDNAEYGKPLCENTVLSTIPGYIICNDGDIEIAGAMKQELDKVSEFLTSGFFYE